LCLPQSAVAAAGEAGRIRRDMGNQARHLYRDASQRLLFDIGVEASEYPRLCAQIAGQFGLKPIGEPVLSCELLLQDYEVEGKVVELSWDHWLGFCVIAKASDAEDLVRQIAEWIASPES
jgi:hypothetical protein